LLPCNGIFGRGIFDALDFFLKGGDDATQSGQNGRAYFGEVTIDFTKRWDMTFGVRHHQQDNYQYQVNIAAALAAGLAEKAPFTVGDEYASYAWALGGNIRTAGPGSPLDPSATTSFDNTSYRFGTSYHVRDDLMVYFGYNEGFNSGGTSSFTDSRGGLVVNNYNPEIIKNTEFGLRGDFFGKRVRLNATVFDTDWLGVQINAQAIDPITGSVLTAITTQNAANGNAKGVDLEVLYSPTKKLTLGANLGFLNTGYTKVKGGLTEPYNLDTTFTGAPDRTYDFSVAYNWGFRNGGSMLTRVGYSYVGQYERSSLLSFREATIVPGRKEAGDFWKLDFRAVYKPSTGKYEISLFGNNLTNQYNLNSGFMHRFWNFDFATVDLPREVGLNFKVSF
jgi:iron complex outermembrane receptor protein